jgi:hypothetical protein
MGAIFAAAGISLERAIMNHCLLWTSFFACLLLPCDVSGDLSPVNILFVANQMEHSVLLVDPISKQVLATVGVDINGHEVAVSPDGRFGYVPIYGNTWVGKPGSNGSTIHVVDLRQGRTVAIIDRSSPLNICVPWHVALTSTSPKSSMRNKRRGTRTAFGFSGIFPARPTLNLEPLDGPT